MHRSIVQRGQVPLETDILTTNKHGLISHGVLAQAILGTGTLVDGLAIAPTNPTSMSLTIGPGSIYQQANIDATPYGTLDADTRTIVKEGIALNPSTMTFTAPTTTGYAQNVLIQAQYQDFDDDPVLRPYFNSSNPQVPLQGPGNNQQKDNTTRKGLVAIGPKAGIAATSGSQTTPSPDVGYVGLYVVTLTTGQTSIASGNISVYTGAPFVPVKLPGVPGGVQREDWTYAVGTGSASSLSASISPVPTALVAGMRVSVRCPFTNGGATTFNLNNLGVKAVVARDGTALLAGDIANGSIIDLRYNGAAWQLVSDRSTPAAIPTIADNSLWHYGTATAGTTAAFTTTLTPVPATASAGLCFRVPITATNTIGTSPATTTIDFGFGAKPIVVNATGAYLAGGELPGGAGYDADFIFDGTSARLVNIVPTASYAKGSFIGTQTFSVAGTYTYSPSPSTKSIIVTVLGGGGGGGGATNGTGSNFSIGGGGGGGGFAISKLLISTSGVSGATITVGVGGAGSPNGNTTGVAGGSSSFGSFASATGGLGAGTSSAASYAHVQTGGNGGSGSGGNLQNGVGQAGAISTGSSNTNYVSGSGGGSLGGYGAGLIASGQSSQLTGYNAVSPGSGGGGAVSAGGSGDAIGGAGMTGYVIIQEYS